MLPVDMRMLRCGVGRLIVHEGVMLLDLLLLPLLRTLHWQDRYCQTNAVRAAASPVQPVHAVTTVLPTPVITHNTLTS